MNSESSYCGLARVVSGLVPVVVRPTIGAISSKGRSYRFCRTKARRSTGFKLSRTTSSASRTKPASSLFGIDPVFLVRYIFGWLIVQRVFPARLRFTQHIQTTSPGNPVSATGLIQS
jgi:hypothetical protein